ncbi:hypothetical protein ACWC09_16475 [Streptomyces sp. NPDC001617]
MLDRTEELSAGLLEVGHPSLPKQERFAVFGQAAIRWFAIMSSTSARLRHWDSEVFVLGSGLPSSLPGRVCQV